MSAVAAAAPHHYIVLLKETPGAVDASAYQAVRATAEASARRLAEYKAVASEIHSRASPPMRPVEATAAAVTSPPRRRRRGGASAASARQAEKTRLLVCTNPFSFTDDVNSGVAAAASIVAPPPSADSHFRIACVAGPLAQEWQAERIARAWSASSRGVGARASWGDGLAAAKQLPFYVDPIVSFEMEAAAAPRSRGGVKRAAVDDDSSSSDDSDYTSETDKSI